MASTAAGAPEAIGVDLGGTKMLVGVVDTEQRVSYRGHEPSHGRSADEVIELLADELAEARRERPGVLAAGLGIPCTIDRERGVAIQAVNLPIEDVPIRDLMRERLGIPVYVDNDANVAALAEYRFGAGRGSRNLVMLTIGTGIGGGLIIDGRVYRGSTGAAGELGHVVVDIDGPPCQGNCPGHGCIESLASGTAIAKEAREAAEREPESALGRAAREGRELDARLLIEAAKEGDATSRGVLDVVGGRLGAALASLANAFDPDVLVLGGGVMAAGELILEPAREELRGRALRPQSRTPVLAAELGPEAGMVGAAAMAMAELEAAR